MHLELKDVLQAVGPNAAIVFAAWIFMGFLQQRYTAAYERYRTLIAQYRGEEHSPLRHSDIRDQILLYKRRCELMRRAVNIGLVAACLLIGALMIGVLNAVFPGIGLFGLLGTLAVLAGFLLVIVAAGHVVVENSIIQRAFDSELDDLEDLTASARRR